MAGTWIIFIVGLQYIPWLISLVNLQSSPVQKEKKIEGKKKVEFIFSKYAIWFTHGKTSSLVPCIHHHVRDTG